MGTGEAGTAVSAGRINFFRPVHLKMIDQPGPARRMFASRLSANGMFIRAPVPPPVGTRVELFFEARGRVLRFGEATVAAILTRDQAQARGRLPGFGVRFTALPPRSRALVEELVRRTPEQATKQRPPPARPPARAAPAPKHASRGTATARVVALTAGAALALGGWAHWAGLMPF